MNLVLHNIRSGWFHTHINLWGPSNLPASVASPQHPLPSSHQQQPTLYVCVYLLSEDLLGPWLSAVTKRLMTEVIEENKSIMIIVIVTDREAKELLLDLVKIFVHVHNLQPK